MRLDEEVDIVAFGARNQSAIETCVSAIDALLEMNEANNEWEDPKIAIFKDQVKPEDKDLLAAAIQDRYRWADVRVEEEGLMFNITLIQPAVELPMAA